MKIIQIVPNSKTKERLKSLLKKQERSIRDKGTTFYRAKEGKWKHISYPGWIDWEESVGGLIIAKISSKKIEEEWKILKSFVGYLERYLAEHIDSITIYLR